MRTQREGMSLSRAVAIAGWLFLVVAARPLTVHGQQIRGVVRDATSHLPVAGAVIVALTASDSTLARSLSGRLGAFSLTVTGNAATRLRVIRIGFQPTSIDLHRADSVEVLLTRLPSLLDTVRLAERNDCPSGGEAIRATAAWEQVRTAFLAASLSHESDPPAIRLLRFNRVRQSGSNPPINRVVRQSGSNPPIKDSIPEIATQSVRTLEGVATHIFASPRSSADVAAQGYMTRDSGGDILYPPDENVLRDESFARDHCFHIEHDRAHPGDIGIAFAPVTDRGDRVDLQGTLWIDSAASAPRLLDFSFTNTALRNPARGSLVFTDAPNGVPLLIEWTLRRLESDVPAEVRQVDGYKVDAFRTPVTVSVKVRDAVRVVIEDGAELARAEWADGSTWVATLPRIEGTVIDPKTRRPRPGVPLTLLNAERSVRADSAGHFVFEELVPGPYRIAIDDTLTAVFYDLLNAPAPRIGWTRPHTVPVERADDGADRPSPLVRTYSVGIDPNPPITVELPPIEDAFRQACGKELRGDTTGVLALFMLSGGEPLPGARVATQWQNGTSVVKRTVRGDDRGRAFICGAPRDQSILMSMSSEGVSPIETTAVIGATRFVALVLLRR